MFQGNNALYNNNGEPQGNQRLAVMTALVWKHSRSLDSDKICADINDPTLSFKKPSNMPQTLIFKVEEQSQNIPYTAVVGGIITEKQEVFKA